MQVPVVQIIDQTPTIIALRAENEALRKSNQQLTLQCSALQADIAIIMTMQDFLKSENCKLAQTNQSLCQQVETFSMQKDVLERTLKDLQNVHHVVCSKYAASQDIQAIVQRDRIAEETTFDAEARRLHMLKEKLLREIDDLRQANTELRKELENVNFAFSEQKEKNLQLEDEISGLQNKIKLQLQEIDSLRAALKGAIDHAEKLQEENNQLREQLRLLSEIDVLRRKYIEVDNQRSQLELLTEQQRKEIWTLSKDNRSLTNELNVQRAHNLDLRTKYAKIDEHIAELEAALDSQSSNNCVLMLKHDVVVIENNTLRDQNKALLTRVEKLEALQIELNNLRADNASLAQTTQELQTHFETCLESATVARREVETMVAEREEVMGQLQDWVHKYEECGELIVKARHADSELTDMRMELLLMREEQARAILREAQLREHLRTSSRFVAD